MNTMSQHSPKTRWERITDNDIMWSFLSSPGAMTAAVVSSIIILACLFAPLIANVGHWFKTGAGWQASPILG